VLGLEPISHECVQRLVLNSALLGSG
jgi:hypothetical protein